MNLIEHSKSLVELADNLAALATSLERELEKISGPIAVSPPKMDPSSAYPQDTVVGLQHTALQTLVETEQRLINLRNHLREDLLATPPLHNNKAEKLPQFLRRGQPSEDQVTAVARELGLEHF